MKRGMEDRYREQTRDNVDSEGDIEFMGYMDGKK